MRTPTGHYRDRIRIEEPDGFDVSDRGEQVRKYKLVGIARAKAQRVSGKESYQADQAVPETKWMITMPGQGDSAPVTQLHRVTLLLATERVVSVVSVISPDGQGREWKIECVESPSAS